MSIIYFENGVLVEIDHYDPLPDDRKKRRKCREKAPESYPRGW